MQLLLTVTTYLCTSRSSKMGRFPSYSRGIMTVHHDSGSQVDARTDAARAYARKKAKADGDMRGKFIYFKP